MIYTVIGLVDNSTQPRTLTVAGVAAGEVQMVDTNPGGPEDAQRWASAFEAADPDEAEEMAHEVMAEEEEEWQERLGRGDDGGY